METMKKVYKIGDKIEDLEQLENIASGMVIKALKIIEVKGNNWATKIIEGKDIDTLEDLKQIVILELIENDYVISKECYRKVNKYLYNYKIEKVKNIEIVVNEEENHSNIDKFSYINYIKEENSIIENKQIAKKFSLDMLGLTEKQKEVLNIYSKLNSYEKTAEILGISKGATQTTIKRIKEKAFKCCYAMEY